VLWPFASTLQVKKKTGKKGKIEMPKTTIVKITDEEKNDIVGQEVELLQAEIDQVVALRNSPGWALDTHQSH
jgi:hypothetical protein